MPPAIIGRMVVTPPAEMVWLSPSDLQSMGTSMVGKPAQISLGGNPAATPQVEPGQPVQIAPQAKASKEVPTWGDIFQKAVKRSSDQNGGKPQFARFCQPEQKVCIIGLSYTQSDGKDGFLKTVEDMDGKIITREVCSFNDFKDVRSCYNWDTGAAHRDMKNATGDWIKIADE